MSKKINFMYNLKKEGFISHNLFSIYSKLDDTGNSSFIKFGGYDEGAVMKNHRLQFIQTSNFTTWGVNLASLHLGSVEKPLEGDRVVFLDYTFPFIYVPQDDFLKISEFYA